MVDGLPQFFDDFGIERCSQFVSVLRELSLRWPDLLIPVLESLIKSFSKSEPSELGCQLLDIIRNVIAFDPSVRDRLCESDIRCLLDCPYASAENVQLLAAFRKFADFSRLATACIELYFTRDLDDSGVLLLKLLEDGLQVGDFVVPKESVGLLRIRFASKLWSVCESKREELVGFMLSCLRFARPFGLYEGYDVVKCGCELLDQVCHEEYVSVIEELKGEVISF
jgi:hypothetical protein